jgi:hypothetical protein
MSNDLPTREIRRRLSWVGFLEPLSEEGLDDLLRSASFVRLAVGEVLLLGTEEQAERMLLLVAGQLQVYEVALGSGRELTLSVLASGAPVDPTGLVPRWVRDLHLRALEPSLVCRIALLGKGTQEPREGESLLETAGSLYTQAKSSVGKHAKLCSETLLVKASVRPWSLIENLR